MSMNEESRFSISKIVVAANRCLNVAAYAYVLNRISHGYAQIEEKAGPLPAGIYKYFTVWTVVSWDSKMYNDDVSSSYRLCR